MPHNPQSLLEDIRRAAGLILKFTTGRSLTDYSTDALLHSAVERQFITIGEALSRLEKLDPGLAGQVSACRQIIGFRNVLVHGYDAIDDQVVSQVIEKDVPILRRQVEDLLTKLGLPEI